MLVKLKLESYNVRIINVIPMGTTKNTVIEFTWKHIGRELKLFII